MGNEPRKCGITGYMDRVIYSLRCFGFGFRFGIALIRHFSTPRPCRSFSLLMKGDRDDKKQQDIGRQSFAT